MKKGQILGSTRAKEGFQNEKDIVLKFNNWKDDKDAQIWLQIMEYNLSEIEYVKAIVLSGYKADVQVQISIKLKAAIDAENLQIKLVSNPKGFNQIDKRWVDKYVEMWNIPKDIAELLKEYTGEIQSDIKDKKDSRRVFANEFSFSDQTKIIAWLVENQSLIVSDILKGRGKFSAEWMLVAQRLEKSTRWVLHSMNYCLNYFGNGDVVITKRGNFRIAKITMQRKGGDAGRKTAQMLQFKINPALLFEN
jgi:hypothetical protein